MFTKLLFDTPRSLSLLNYLVEPEGEDYQEKLSCENATGADNQQERLRTVGWIVGFVDGEGCFSVTIQKATRLQAGKFSLRSS